MDKPYICRGREAGTACCDIKLVTLLFQCECALNCGVFQLDSNHVDIFLGRLRIGIDDVGRIAAEVNSLVLCNKLFVGSLILRFF